MAINRENPTRRTAQIWIGITLLAIFGIFAPSVFGIDGFDGGFAISTISLVIAITAAITVVIFHRMANAVDRVLRGEDLLAHWEYSPEEWRRYTEKEYAEDRAAKKGLFILIAIISVIVGTGFVIFVPDSLAITAIMIASLIILIGAVAFISARYEHYRNVKSHGEAFITRTSVYLNRRIHLWKGIGTRFEGAELRAAGRRPAVLAIEYSAFARHGRNYYTIRIPVPVGQEETAKHVLNEIITANPAKK